MIVRLISSYLAKISTIFPDSVFKEENKPGLRGAWSFFTVIHQMLPCVEARLTIKKLTQ